MKKVNKDNPIKVKVFFEDLIKASVKGNPRPKRKPKPKRKKEKKD